MIDWKCVMAFCPSEGGGGLGCSGCKQALWVHCIFSWDGLWNAQGWCNGMSSSAFWSAELVCLLLLKVDWHWSFFKYFNLFSVIMRSRIANWHQTIYECLMKLFDNCLWAHSLYLTLFEVWHLGNSFLSVLSAQNKQPLYCGNVCLQVCSWMCCRDLPSWFCWKISLKWQ